MPRPLPDLGHRITVRELAELVERGVIDGDARVELVRGRLVSYAPPQGPKHAAVVRGFPFVVYDRLRDRAVLSPQMPVVISDDTQLEPDLAVLAIRAHGYRSSHPTAADVHCVIEVCDSSARRDRVRKLRLYAAAGIAEYWIVDVPNEHIDVYREPGGPLYASHRVARRGDSVSFSAFPDVTFTVDELLG
ncbi:MAG TPA: Uma2 family endonuclease [Candidatus Elarobacter sp.]|nr:Uma2 family endonuclease [Candidatus Elarobacter sp.]